MGKQSVTLMTIGHGSASQAVLTERLTEAGVELLVDIRRFPGSRAHPHVAREALEQWLPDAGVAYRWEQGLGGRRRLSSDGDSPDTWWTVEAFRAYAGYTRTPEFGTALDRLTTEAATARTVVMCSETVWWRCHRRLVADVAALTRAMEVLHLLPGRPPQPHPPSAGARVCEDGTVIWDRQ